MRTANITRTTKETNIKLTLNLDGNGIFKGTSGIGFFDHMLTLLTFYASFDLNLEVTGDLETGTHHTVEDIGIVLGQALSEALGSNKGIKRYASNLTPMDYSLIECAIDCSGRPALVYNIDFKRTMIADMALEDFSEFFIALVNNFKFALHINVRYGVNDHHKIEGAFKALGRCFKEALTITGDQVTSTKGLL